MKSAVAHQDNTHLSLENINSLLSTSSQATRQKRAVRRVLGKPNQKEPRLANQVRAVKERSRNQCQEQMEKRRNRKVQNGRAVGCSSVLQAQLTAAKRGIPAVRPLSPREIITFHYIFIYLIIFITFKNTYIIKNTKFPPTATRKGSTRYSSSTS